MITHHPSEYALAAYVAGRLSEAFALSVATHAAGCEQCRGDIRLLERVGGALLEAMDPTPMSPGAWDRMQARMNQPAAPSELTAILHPELPGPLQRVRMTPWTPRVLGLRLRYIRTRGPGLAVLLEADPGRKLVWHTPHDREWIAVLRGAHVDQTGRYERGDFAELGIEHTIKPESGGSEPVLALLATDGLYVGGVDSLFGRLQRKLGL